MQNVGEEIAGEYLKIIKGCSFVEYNLYTPDVQGEIDVVGVDVLSNVLYVCEVAVHLVTGLQYVNAKVKQPDNVNRFSKNFLKISNMPKNISVTMKRYLCCGHQL